MGAFSCSHMRRDQEDSEKNKPPSEARCHHWPSSVQPLSPGKKAKLHSVINHIPHDSYLACLEEFGYGGFHSTETALLTNCREPMGWDRHSEQTGQRPSAHGAPSRAGMSALNPLIYRSHWTLSSTDLRLREKLERCAAFKSTSKPHLPQSDGGLWLIYTFMFCSDGGKPYIFSPSP